MNGALIVAHTQAFSSKLKGNVKRNMTYILQKFFVKAT